MHLSSGHFSKMIGVAKSRFKTPIEQSACHCPNGLSGLVVAKPSANIPKPVVNPNAVVKIAK